MKSHLLRGALVCLLVACSSPSGTDTTTETTSNAVTTASAAAAPSTTDTAPTTVISVVGTTVETTAVAPEVPDGGVLFEIDDEEASAPGQVPWGLVNVTMFNGGGDPHAVFVTEDTILWGVFLAPGSHSQGVVEFSQDGTYFFEELLTFTGPPDVEFAAGGAASEAAAPSPGVTVGLAEFAFSMPETVASGPQWWQLTNNGEQLHDVAIFELEGTLEQLLSRAALLDPRSQPTAVPTWAVGPGQTLWVDVDLSAGSYAVLCRVPDDASRARHFQLGMTGQFMVEG
ncbi:MAG TPA: hypothetical protein VIB78_05770 [Acidimicrobiia bacterium]|jgi:hypothetical protein